MMEMAIKGKKLYALYLDEKKTEYVKAFLETTKNKRGFSGLVDDYISTMYRTLKLSGYRPGEKVTVSQMWRIFKNGVVQDI